MVLQKPLLNPPIQPACFLQRAVGLAKGSRFDRWGFLDRKHEKGLWIEYVSSPCWSRPPSITARVSSLVRCTGIGNVLRDVFFFMRETVVCKRVSTCVCVVKRKVICSMNWNLESRILNVHVRLILDKMPTEVYCLLNSSVC